MTVWLPAPTFAVFFFSQFVIKTGSVLSRQAQPVFFLPGLYCSHYLRSVDFRWLLCYNNYSRQRSIMHDIPQRGTYNQTLQYQPFVVATGASSVPYQGVPSDRQYSSGKVNACLIINSKGTQQLPKSSVSFANFTTMWTASTVERARSDPAAPTNHCCFRR